MHFHKWDMNYVEGLMPYEKHMFLDMLQKHVQEQEENARDAHAAAQYQAQKGRR